MLRLSDTSIRIYRKRDWSTSVRLKTYLMIECKNGTGFRLASYLNQFDCSVTFENGTKVALDQYSYDFDCVFGMNHMVYELSAHGTTHLESHNNGVGLLQIEYRVFSYPGQGDPSRISLVVPVLARGAFSQRWKKNGNAENSNGQNDSM